MESFHTSESRAADAELNGSLSEDDDDAPPDKEVLEMARIDEYRQESLHEEDSLESCLGTRVGGLLEFALRYEQYINRLLAMSGRNSGVTGNATRDEHLSKHLATDGSPFEFESSACREPTEGRKIKSPSPRIRR